MTAAPILATIKPTKRADGFSKSVTLITAPSTILEPRDVIVGRYEIQRVIAEGGMGMIYLARQLGLDRQVAIKTLLPAMGDKVEFLARLEREARAVKALTHPNTVRLYDFGKTEQGMVYLVMEYLEGETLDSVISRLGKLSEANVAHIGQQALKSLVEAHGHGIVHRDIKPSNIMLCHQLGETNFVKLLDFGLARSEVDSSNFKTRVGASLGTPHYMSPEQAAGRTVDARGDLYALGLTLFELLVGQPAYDGNSLYEVAMRHMSPEPVPIPLAIASTPLGKVITRAVEKARANRFQTAQEMLTALSATSNPGELELIPTKWSSDVSIPDPSQPSQPSMHTPKRAETEDMTAVNDLSWKRPNRRLFATGAGLIVIVSALLLVINLTSSDDETRGSIDANATRETAAPDELVATADGSGEGSSLGIVSVGETVRLHVISQPEGATVLLDGRALCNTPCEEQVARRPGTGWVTLLLEDHVSEHEVELSVDASLQVVITPTTRQDPEDESIDGDHSQEVASVVNTSEESDDERGHDQDEEDEEDDRRDEDADQDEEEDSEDDEEEDSEDDERRLLPVNF